MSPRTISYDELEALKENMEAREHAYLRQKGWEYKCDLPGAFWLWQKRMGDHVIAVDTDHAISIQSHLDVN